jgi:hypothetical protein
MRDRAQGFEDDFDLPVTEEERVAAGDDDVPDLGVLADIIQPVLDVAGVHLGRVADHPFPGAEAAIGGAAVGHEEKDAVGVAVDHTRDGRIMVLLEGVRIARVFPKLRRVGHDLPPDRAPAVLDQAGIVGRDLGLEDPRDPLDLVTVEAEAQGDLLRLPETALENPYPVVHGSFRAPLLLEVLRVYDPVVARPVKIRHPGGFPVTQPQVELPRGWYLAGRRFR